jgi:hypothetical protein
MPRRLHEKGNETMNTLQAFCASLILLVLIGCGGGSSSKTTATPTPTPTGTPFPNDQHLAQALPVKMGTTGGNSTDSTVSGTKITCCSGTLGALVQQGGNFLILSNNHVLNKSDHGAAGDPITQPGLVDNNCNGGSLVAHLMTAAALKPTSSSTTGICSGQPSPCGPSPSNVDAAIALIVSGTVDTSGSILDLGAAGAANIAAAPPSSTLASPATVLGSGEGVAKSGRSTGLTCSTLQSINTEVSVVYNVSCGGAAAFTSTFNNQVIINGGSFSAMGDSGSLVVTKDTARPVGLLYGGNSTSSSANPMQDVFNAFAGGGAMTIVGGSDHAVSCASQVTVSSASLSPGASAAQLSQPERQRVVTVQQRRAAELMQDRAVSAVDIGASEDSPGEGALIVRLAGVPRSPVPPVIDGVRTKVVFSPQAGTPKTPALSRDAIDQATATKETYAEGLMSQPGIQGVGVGRSDDNTAETAIVIYVLSGQPRPPIPAVLEGVRTKIVEGDRFRAFDWGKETKATIRCVKK